MAQVLLLAADHLLRVDLAVLCGEELVQRVQLRHLAAHQPARIEQRAHGLRHLGLELRLLDEHVEPREEQLGVLAEQVVRLERVVLADDVLDQDARVRLLVVLEQQRDLAPVISKNKTGSDFGQLALRRTLSAPEHA